jgi:hypothetical protein
VIERFARWLHGRLTREGIELLTVEHFLPQGAKVRVTDASREGQLGLGYAARPVPYAELCGKLGDGVRKAA